MSYLQTIQPEEATGTLQELYEADRKALGFVFEPTIALSMRPDVIAVYRNLRQLTETSMPPRRYELLAIATTTRLQTST